MPRKKNAASSASHWVGLTLLALAAGPASLPRASASLPAAASSETTCKAEANRDAPQLLAVKGLRSQHPLYAAGSGGNTSGDELIMRHNAGFTLAKTCKGDTVPDSIQQLYLLGGSIEFTVDLRRVGCGCNLAFYLVASPALDVAGEPILGTGEYAPYYCDANKVGGQWCPEIDVMEANNHAFQATPHKCDPPINGHHYTSCDRAGCGQNTKDMAEKTYGPGPENQIDTTRAFTVNTSFLLDQSDGTFGGMRTILHQEGKHVTLEHSNCAPEYLKQMDHVIRSGLSLRTTYWGRSSATMAWMDHPLCGKQECSGHNAGDGVVSGIRVHEIKNASSLKPANTGVSASTPPDCTVKPPDWENGWSTSKRAWCCKHVGRGCDRYNCFAGLEDALEGDGGTGSWSAAKRVWCCRNKYLGCGGANFTVSSTDPSRATGPVRWSNHAEKCVTVDKRPGSTGREIIVWDCQGAFGDANQVFRSIDGQIQWLADPTLCLAVQEEPAIAKDGTPAVLKGCLKEKEQRFLFPGGGMKMRWESRPEMCLDVADHDLDVRNGARLLLSHCSSDDTDQVFAWEAAAVPKGAPPLLPLPTTTAAPSTTTVVTTSLSSSRGFDVALCSSDDVEAWPEAKRSRCCKEAGRGCEAQSVPSFDCEAGLVTWEVGWSEEKKRWCCVQVGLGCSSTPRTTTSLPFDCLVGFGSWKTGWSREKKDWCCREVGLACVTDLPETSLTTTPVSIDCRVGFSNPAVQAWCCAQRGIGCTKHPSIMTATTTLHFDCDAGYSTWLQGWSAKKKVWCCRYKSRGCSTTLAPLTTTRLDCRLDLSLWESKWSSSKKDWCCKEVGIGCSTTKAVLTTPQAFRSRTEEASPLQQRSRCAAASSSLDRRDREWCCRVHGVHCKSLMDTTPVNRASHDASQTPQKRSPLRFIAVSATTTLAPRYDCMAEYTNGGSLWSPAKRTWCCKHVGHGCHVGPRDYDCTYWFSVEIWTWPIEKQDWCCKHRGRGCKQGKAGRKEALDKEATAQSPETTSAVRTTTEQPFDEMSCYDRHDEKFWSSRKRSWCCKTARRGCLQTSSSFNCEEGYWDWEMAWSDRKREWCCENHQRGCGKEVDSTHLLAGISRKFEASTVDHVSQVGTVSIACAAGLVAGLLAVRSCNRRLESSRGYVAQTALWTGSSVPRGPPSGVDLDEAGE